MPLADVFSLLVLGQGKSGLDVARWALAHPERVSAVTVYGGGTSEPMTPRVRLRLLVRRLSMGPNRSRAPMTYA